MKHVTDRVVLQAIWNEYYKKFEKNDVEYDVEIDLMAISKKLKINYGILWGRFYFDMNERYTHKDNRKLFYPTSNSNVVLIHFPLLYAILSREHERHINEEFVPFLSLLIALASMGISLLK